MNPFRKIFDYFKKHLYIRILLVGIAFFVMSVFIFQTYLRREYYQYLRNEAAETERVILDVSAVNLNSMLRDAVVAGAGVALDGKLLTQVEEVTNASYPQYREILDLRASLNNIVHNKSEIAAAAVVTDRGLLCEFGRYWSGGPFGKLWSGDALPILEDLYRDTLENAGVRSAGNYVIRTEPHSHTGFPSMLLFHIAYPLVGNGVDKTSSGAVIVLTFQLDKMVKTSGLGDAGMYKNIVEYITDADGTVLYYKDSDYLGKKDSDTNLKREDSPVRQLDYFGWEIHTGIDYASMENQIHRMFLNGMGVYLFLLLLCIVIWQLVIRHILKPVTVIGDAMEKVRDGSLEQQIEIRGEHELWQLAKEYNRTLGALQEQQRRTHQEYEEKMEIMRRCSEAEREALESQINAHFLFNTLGAINYSAIESGAMEVSDLLKNLSNILYYSFSKKRRNVTLGEEMDWVDQYLYLQKYRLMDVFDYEISFPEEYSEWPCCKLFLQPFVENSILHGFEGWDSGGMIRISGREEQGRLCIEVKDNGCGMKPEIRDTILGFLSQKEAGRNSGFEENGAETENETLMKNSHEEKNGTSKEEEPVGIGIRNCITRMRMYYGPELEVTLQTEEGKGTCFTFLLPIPEVLLLEEEEGEA